MSGNCLVEVVWCIVVHIDQHRRKMAQRRLQKIIDATIRHASTYVWKKKQQENEEENEEIKNDNDDKRS